MIIYPITVNSTSGFESDVWTSVSEVVSPRGKFPEESSGSDYDVEESGNDSESDESDSDSEQSPDEMIQEASQAESTSIHNG